MNTEREQDGEGRTLGELVSAVRVHMHPGKMGGCGIEGVVVCTMRRILRIQVWLTETSL